MGIRGKALRNTSAHANQVREWRIYVDFAWILIAIARTRHLRIKPFYRTGEKVIKPRSG